MTSARARGRATRAFTLVEMTVVLLIVALGTVLAIPMVESGFDSREVRRAARQIVATMHYCRGEAVATGAPQQLIIDPENNSIRTADQGRWVILTDRAMIGKVAGGVSFGDGTTQILFFPNGSTSGARIPIASRRDPSNRLDVTLDRLIGNVRVEETTG